MQKVTLLWSDRRLSWRLLAMATTFAFLLLSLGATASMQNAADPAVRKQPTRWQCAHNASAFWRSVNEDPVTRN